VDLRILTGTALFAALAAGTLSAAGAQTAPYPGTAPVPVVQPRPYNGGSGRQYESNLNIEKAARRVGGMIAKLEHDARDYGGHRVTAISDLTNAHNELLAAEQFAQSHGYPPPAEPQHVNHGNGGGKGERRSVPQSNYQIEKVQVAVQRMIEHLQQDTKDYGGHRVAAINWLNQANSELGIAVQWEQSHPNA
jgi:hypothetical protein